jgi:hypothetical protein
MKGKDDHACICPFATGMTWRSRSVLGYRFPVKLSAAESKALAVSKNERARYIAREMRMSIDEAKKKLADAGPDKHDNWIMSLLEQIYDLGWKNGRAAGYRVAKGRKGASKKRGPPRRFGKEIDVLCDWADLQVRENPGTGVREALRYSLKIMQRGEREVLKKTGGSTLDGNETANDTAQYVQSKYRELTLAQVEGAYYRRPRESTPTS